MPPASASGCDRGNAACITGGKPWRAGVIAALNSGETRPASQFPAVAAATVIRLDARMPGPKGGQG
jgi:hypothetical protein